MARDGRSRSDDGNGYPDALDLLSDATRVSILRELGRADGPIHFAELRRRVGLGDSGTFNHHLSKLVGVFVERTDAGYTLASAGSRLVTAADTAIAADDSADHGSGPDADTDETPVVDGDCPVCGDPDCERLYHVHLQHPSLSVTHD